MKMDKRIHKTALDAEIKAFGNVCRMKSSSTSPKGDRRLNPMNVDLVRKKMVLQCLVFAHSVLRIIIF